MPSMPMRRMLIGLRARYHLWSGRRAYRAGRIRMAAHHLAEALSCGHRSFDAFLLLGKIAYRQRDMGRAAEHFDHARSTDPMRFSLEGFPNGFLASLRRQPESSPRLHYRIVIQAHQARDGGRSRAGPAERRKQRRLGDFASHSEWLKHRDLPVFRPGEGQDIDWDEEARGLFDG